MRSTIFNLFLIAIALNEITAQLDSCSKSPCKNGGTCLDKSNLFLGYKCECDSNYKGYNCQIRKKRNDEQNDEETEESTTEIPTSEDEINDSNDPSDIEVLTTTKKQFANINILGQNIGINDFVPKETIDSAIETVRDKTNININGQNINIYDSFVGNASAEDVAQTIHDKTKDLPLPIILAIILILIVVVSVIGGCYYCFFYRNK